MASDKHTHEWFVTGVSLTRGGAILTKCRCGAKGYIRNPNTKEFDRAITAVHGPYKWPGKNTDVRKDQGKHG